MAILEEDTLYYRADHPLGYIFSAGNEEPDPADGWVEAAENIEPLPEREFECSTLEAYENLLRSERSAAVQGTNAINRLAALLRASEGHRMVLTAEVGELNAEVDRLTAELANLQHGEGA